MNLKHLSNAQLVESLESKFEAERCTSHSILLHLAEVVRRKLYADRGYESMFVMLIKHFRQSETQAYERLKALKLMAVVPAVEEKLKSGEINMSTLALAQRQINREEKVTGAKISNEKKAEIVERISNKTIARAEKELMEILPEAATAPKTSERRVSKDATRLGLTIPDQLLEKLQKLKDHWAHVDPNMDWVEVIERTVDMALKKVDPTQKKTRSATESVKPCGNRPTYYSVNFDKVLWTRAGSRCEFTDKQSGRRCECTFGLEREHIIPIGLGGSNELSNIALLCKAHNLLMARRVYSKPKTWTG